MSGFTLIELLVVIAIISILAGVILANVGDGSAISRDAKRQADLRAIETALELYKLEYGRYPERCANANAGAADGWSGQAGTNFACASGSQYIKGDISGTPEVEVFSPKFISVLPIDPRLNGTNSGYVYTVDAGGTVYKMMVYNNVESEEVSNTHEFSRCGNVQSTAVECVRWSSNNPDALNQTPPHCIVGGSGDYKNDYAVSAGYSPGGTYLGSPRTDQNAKDYFTRLIRCK